MIPKTIIEKILDKASLVELVGASNLKRQRGGFYMGCCPFHSEKTPSFKVDDAKGLYYCFGCGKGGNAINYVMEDQRLTYQGAVKWLADHLHIEYEERKETDKEREDRLRREALLGLMARVAAFYVELFYTSKEAQTYAYRRWGEKFCKEFGIGYAPGNGHVLLDWAKTNGENLASLKELTLLSVNDHGEYYDFYRDRVMIPITDRVGNVLSFTARDISGKKEVEKYKNGGESPIYIKGNNLFGIQSAWRQASREEKVYAVEGAPDCMRLQDIGVVNTIAPLGTSWTDRQFNLVKRVAHNVCFIPDNDPPKQGEQFGRGVLAVIRNGKKAIEYGLAVTVKQIPTLEEGKKQDPDEYFTDLAIFKSIEEEDFTIWLSRLRFDKAETTAERTAAVTEIAELLAKIEDETMVSFLLDDICQLSKTKEKFWREAINRQKKCLHEKEQTKSPKSEIDLLGKYGFYVRNNCYFSTTKDGDPLQWSNFTLKPMYHIKDSISAIRTYLLKNERGEEVMLELKQEELVAIMKFKQRVESLGNFIWMVGDKELTKLKPFLYDETESAAYIKHLGWQPQGFYAWGNGIWDGTKFIHVDEMGIVKLEEIGNFYLPAFSKEYINNWELFKFEKDFAHFGHSKVSLREFTDQLFIVFGDKGRIGFCFLLATLFRDIVVAETRFFPILDLFGPKGSGKTDLANTLMSFFIIKNVAPNLTNTTIPAMGDALEAAANALCHLEEYRNDIDANKREFLKGVWDGAGRTRKNMDLDKRKETTAITSGLILSGQEMPTADIALFSRLIFLTFGKSDFSLEEKKEHQKLYELRTTGLSHLTLQILTHRKKMEVDFRDYFRITQKEIANILVNENIEDRILNNWVLPLAVLRTLDSSLNLSIHYEDMKDVAIEGIKRQNQECSANNEVGNFWSAVQYLYSSGEIQAEGDFDIKMEHGIKTDIQTAEWLMDMPVLYLQKSRIFTLFKKLVKQVGDNALSEGSLKYYLQNSKGYLGEKVWRFKVFSKTGTPVYEESRGPGTKLTQKTTTQRAFCFDYNYLKEHFQINLLTNIIGSEG